jgi:hypothetical protein
MLSIFALFTAFITYSEELSNTNMQCKGLSKSERFSALGLEIGMCLDESKQLFDKNNKEFLLLPSENIDHLTFVLSDYIGSPPPEEDKIISNSQMLLSFYKNILFSINMSFHYASVDARKSALQIMDFILSKNYGKGTIVNNYSYTKLWTYGDILIELSIPPETGRLKTMELNYTHNGISNSASKEINRNKNDEINSYIQNHQRSF